MKRILLVLLAALCLAQPTYAGFDEGAKAYERGDYATAIKEFRALAEQEVTKAQGYLGFMHFFGRGVPQDYAEAMKWFSKAADKGDAEAQNFLGVMYSKGQGVPQDYVKAHMWFSLAATNGTSKVARLSVEYRNLIAAEMTPEQIAEARP